MRDGDFEVEYMPIGSKIKITHYIGDDLRVKIPEYIKNLPVTIIGDRAFYDCRNLKNIVIPNSVKEIGDWAFASCKSLTEITIPISITQIGGFIFTDCGKLKRIKFPVIKKNLPSLQSFLDKYADKIEYYDEIQSTAKKLKSKKNNDLQIDPNFTYLKNGNGIIITGYFGSCSNVEIPKYIEKLPVTEIGNNAFYCREGVTKFKIPNSVTKIDDYAFGGCVSLTDIAIPNSVTQIGNGAFWYCKSLTEINIPNSVTQIGDKAFSLCENLKEINIPNSVTQIGDMVFWRCESLKSIKFPSENKYLPSLKVFLKKYVGIIEYEENLIIENLVALLNSLSAVSKVNW